MKRISLQGQISLTGAASNFSATIRCFMSPFKIIGQNVDSDSSAHDAERALASNGSVAVVTLGCAKNQVDSEVMAGVLKSEGFNLVADVAEADIALVNTCGFLQSAVKEGVDCILEISKYKESGRLKRVIVAGCMVQRYRQQLIEALPEADTFMMVDDIMKVADVVKAAAKDAFLLQYTESERPHFLYDENSPRELSTLPHTAYVKVSEGCNRPCAFCLIPSLRGEMRSRRMESVIEEVRQLAAKGVREVNLIAQDTTAYGLDLKVGQSAQQPSLIELMREIDKLGLPLWQRLLYAYPTGINNELLEAIVSLPSVCEYIDIPLQHSSEAVLRAMRRPIGRFSARALVETIREKAPSISLRTTFIAGFPGETEKDVEDLENFILEGHFLSLGVFAFSREEGTPSYDMPGQIPAKEKESRRKRLMIAQQKAVSKKLEGFVGQNVEVLVEGPHQESELLLAARGRFQAPEVDGLVIINDIEEGAGSIEAGSIRRVEITGVAGYDLLATLKA